jgi:hypothetical protein
MLESVLLNTLWFDLGSWFGIGIAKFGKRERNQAILINGSDNRISIPILDKFFEKNVMHATRTQRVIAIRIAMMLRVLTNTRVFELLAIQKLNESWPGKRKLDPKVRLFV